MPATRDALAPLKRPAPANGDGAAAAPPAAARQLIRDYALQRGWNAAGSYFGFAANLTGETAAIRGQYTEMAFREPSVKAPLLSRIWGVASQDAECKAAPPAGPRDQDVAAAFLFALKNSKGGIPQIVWEIGLPAAVHGSSLCEIVFDARVRDREPYAGRRMLRAVKAKHPTSYQLKADDFGDLAAVRAVAGGEEFSGDALRRFILYTPLSLYGDLQGVADLRAAYGAYARKDMLWKLRQYYLDKFSGPFLKGTTAAAKEPMKAALAEARGAGFIVVAPGEEVEVLDLAMGSDAAFKSAIDDCDRDMAIAVGGSHLPFREGQTSGARGDSQQQTEMAELWAWQLSYAVQHILSTQVAPLWVEENYAGAAAPEFVFGGVDRAEQTAAVAQVATLVGAGKSLSKSQVAERTGWVDPKDAADTLPGAAPKPQAAGVGAAPGGAPGPAPAGFAEGAAWTLEVAGD